MGNLDPRVTRAAGIYFGLIVVIVIAAQLGIVPGTFDRPLLNDGGPAGHPYQLVMRATVLLLAVALGALTAWAGEVLGGWHLGLAALIVGGMITGTALAFAPSILFPDDQYPVTFAWLVMGAPVGFASWLACMAALRAARPAVA